MDKLKELKEMNAMANALSKDFVTLMLGLIEANAGKDIDQSIADGTLAEDVDSAHKRFVKETKLNGKDSKRSSNIRNGNKE